MNPSDGGEVFGQPSEPIWCASGCLFFALFTLMYITFALYLMVYSYRNDKVRVAVCFWYLWEKFQWAVTLPAPSRAGNRAYIRAAEWKGFIVLRWIRWMSVEQRRGLVLRKDWEAFYQSALGHMNSRRPAEPFKHVLTSVVKDNIKSEFIEWNVFSHVVHDSWCNKCHIRGENYIKINMKWHFNLWCDIKR